MAPFPEVQALPGDVVRRSPKRPTEVFDSLVRYFNDQPGYDQMGVDVTVLSLAEHESWLEVDLMFEFVVFRVAVRVFEDEAEVPTGTVVSFRDLLRQDSLRFSKLVHLIEHGVLLDADSKSDNKSDSKPTPYLDFDEEDDLELHAGEAMETVLALMTSCVESQKSAPDAAQILAFWAHNSPCTRATIAQAAAQRNVVQGVKEALTQQSKQNEVLPQVYPLLAALQQSACIAPEDLAALKVDAMKGSEATSLVDLASIPFLLGPYRLVTQLFR